MFFRGITEESEYPGYKETGAARVCLKIDFRQMAGMNFQTQPRQPKEELPYETLCTTGGRSGSCL